MVTLKSVFSAVSLMVLFLFHAEYAVAHWQRQDDAPAFYDDYKISLRVNRDYTTEVIEEFTATITKEAAIKDFTIVSIGYVAELSQVKVLAAKTINGAHSIQIDPSLIMDQAVASKQPGYDSVREIRFSLPQLAVGSKVYLKILKKSYPRAFPNFVSEMIPFDEEYPVHSYQLQLDSTIPITHKFFDPWHQFAITENSSKGASHLSAKSTSTVFHRIEAEPYSVFTEPQVPVFYMSSGTDWPSFGNPIAAEYDRILREPLPPDFLKIVEDAKTKKLPLDQIEYVLSALQKLIHYVGNWQTIRGKYYPRALREIATSRYGDCKDYTAAATVILKAMGFDATPAWTKLAEETQLPPTASATPVHLINFKPPLPGQYFNHAVLKVTVENKEIWLDPTSPVPYSRGIPLELAGTYALTLKPNAAKIETIPLPSRDENELEKKTFIAINGDRTSDTLSRVKLRGYLASLFRYQSSKFYKMSPQRVDRLLSEYSGMEVEKKEDDLGAEVQFDQGEPGVDLSSSTSAGAGIQFSLNKSLLPFVMDHTQTAGSLFIASSGKITETTIIQGGALLGELPKPCHVESPWFTAARSFSKEDQYLKVKEEIEIKSSLIPNLVLQSTEMKASRESLKNCWMQTTLVFQPQALDDPNYPYHYTLPWTWSSWDIQKIKVQHAFSRGVKAARQLVSKPSEPKLEPELNIVPEWTNRVSPQELKSKLTAVLDRKGENLLPFIAAKLIMLQLARQHPEDPDYLSFLSRSELTLGYIKGNEHTPKSLDRTKYYIYHALELNPFDPLANRMLAWFFIDTGRLIEARDQARFAIALDPYSKRARLLQAEIFNLNQEYEQALNIVKDMDEYSFLTEIYIKMKRYDEAEAAYEDNARYNPGPWSYMGLASFLTQIRKNPDKAIDYAKKSLEAGETGMGHSVLSDALTFKGDDLWKEKKFDESAEYYQMAIAEKNDNERAQHNLGQLLFFMGQKQKNADLLNKASEHLSLAVKISPDHAKTRELLNKIPSVLSSISAGEPQDLPQNRTPASIAPLSHGK